MKDDRYEPNFHFDVPRTAETTHFFALVSQKGRAVVISPWLLRS